VSAPYQAVQWNAFKRRYDAAIAVGVAGYLGAFFAVSKLAFGGDRAFSDEVILIRATGSCAIVLLHVVLCIGPLTRMSTKFLPLLYNRRHLGVTTFAVAVVHGVVAIGFYHGFGVISPLRSLLTSNTSYSSLVAFPFETLGLFGLGVLFLLAATSHDFWLKNLTPTAWKWLHMLIYPTWAALVLHAALGAMQSRDGATYPTVLIAGAAVVASLHLVAARMQRRRQLHRRLRRGRDSAESRAASGASRRLFGRGVSARALPFGRVEPVRAPGRAGVAGPDHRRLHHLPLARPPVSTEKWARP
jgi:methionine sulfoxide reductase heme-binding subunit